MKRVEKTTETTGPEGPAMAAEAAEAAISEGPFTPGRTSLKEISTSVPSNTSTQEVALWLLGSSVEAAHDGFCILHARPGHLGTILYVNPAFTQITGYELHDVIGRTPEIFLDPQTDSEFFELPLPRLKKGDSWGGESAAYRKGGEPFQMSWRRMPLVDQRRRISHNLLILRDVTQERHNGKMRSWLEAAVERSDETVVVCNRRLRIELVNPAFEELMGMTSEQAQGLPVWRLPMRPRRLNEWRRLRTSLEEKDLASTTFEHRASATVQLLELSATCVRDEGGVHMAYVFRCLDVTERRRLESMTEAINMSKSLGYVFSGIRHELGNPINSMKAALSVLRRGIDRFSADRVKEYLDNVLHEMVRVEDLLRSLSSFNAFEHPKIEPVQANEFLKRLAQLVSSDLERQHVRLRVEVSPQEFFVAADPRALLQVMLNLVTNAADSVASERDPCVQLRVGLEKSQGVFEVIDNGIGFRAEDADRLTQPFYTTKAKGTGLGLSISQKLLSRMGGVLELSGALEKGCRATVLLNVHEPGKAGS